MSRKKVLLITYYWPPTGGPGVQRWLKFTKYFVEKELDVIVYTPSKPTYPLYDYSLINNDLQIEVIKVPIFEPQKLFFTKYFKKRISMYSTGMCYKKKQSITSKILHFVRGNFFIPDSRVFWRKPSVKYLTKLIVERRITSVITTGPPHSLHLIGYDLKKRTGVNWITDFRDPWTTIFYHDKLLLTKSSKLKHIALEQLILNNSDQVVVTSFSTKKEFRKKTLKPITLITNGFEEVVVKNISLDKAFTLTHIGTLFPERNPQIFWQAIDELIKENKDFQEDLKIKLIGSVSPEIKVSIRSYNLTECVNIERYLPFSEVLKIQRQSQVLLLFEINSENTKAIIPGKLFEYLAAKRPILAIGPKAWDVNIILKETKSGCCFSYENKVLLKRTILANYNLFLKNKLKVETTDLEKYNCENLADDYFKIIK